MGTPRCGWMDNINRDVRDLGLEETRTEQAKDKTRWRKMCKSAKTIASLV